MTHLSCNKKSIGLVPLVQRLGMNDVCVMRGLLFGNGYHPADCSDVLQLLREWNSAGFITSVAVRPTSLKELRRIVSCASSLTDSLHLVRALLAWTYCHYVVTAFDGERLELVVPIHYMEG